MFKKLFVLALMVAPVIDCHRIIDSPRARTPSPHRPATPPRPATPATNN